MSLISPAWSYVSTHKATYTVYQIGHESSVEELRGSPDGLWIASTDHSSVILWDAATGCLLRHWSLPRIDGIVFTPDNKHLAICTRTRLVLQEIMPPYNMVAETPLDKGADKCIWSPNGALYAHFMVLRRKIRLIIYRTDTTEKLELSHHDLPHPHRASSRRQVVSTYPSFSHDSRWIVFTQSVSVRDAEEDSDEEFESITWIWDLYSAEPPHKLVYLGPEVVDSVFNPINPAQVFITFDDGTIRVQDVESGAILTDVVTECDQPSPDIVYSPDGRHVAIRPGARGSSSDDAHCLCDIETGTLLYPFDEDYAYPFDDDYTYDLYWRSFSPDSTRILSSSFHAPAMLWDTRTHLPVKFLEAHIHLILVAAFSPHSRYIAAGYQDGTVRVWNAADGACLGIYTEHTDSVYKIGFSPDGEILYTGGHDGIVYIRRLCEVVPLGVVEKA